MSFLWYLLYWMASVLSKNVYHSCLTVCCHCYDIMFVTVKFVTIITVIIIVIIAVFINWNSRAYMADM